MSESDITGLTTVCGRSGRRTTQAVYVQRSTEVRLCNLCCCGKSV